MKKNHNLKLFLLLLMIEKIASQRKSTERTNLEHAIKKLSAESSPDYIQDYCDGPQCLYEHSQDKHTLKNITISPTEAAAQLQAYCARHHKNLPCKTRCRRRETCGNIDSPYKSLSDAARFIIRDNINMLRDIISSGAHRDHFPTAANMRVINYDLECEFFAGCYLKGCFNQDVYPKIALDGTHLGATGYGYVSFNMTVNRIDIPQMIMAFTAWTYSAYGASRKYPYNNPNFYDFLLHDKIPNYSNDFLQMYAANTTHIGCALYNRNLSSHLIFYQFYCVYRQALIYTKNFELYKIGPPASACEEWGEKVSSVYFGLCGEVRLLSDDEFVPFMDLNSSISVIFSLKLIFMLYLILLVI